MLIFNVRLFCFIYSVIKNVEGVNSIEIKVKCFATISMDFAKCIILKFAFCAITINTLSVIL
jgi:hypothetical protein